MPQVFDGYSSYMYSKNGAVVGNLNILIYYSEKERWPWTVWSPRKRHISSWTATDEGIILILCRGGSYVEGESEKGLSK